MYKKKLEDDIRCPLEYALGIFGGKWESRIICVLGNLKVLRYSEIRKELTNISDAVLSSTLRKLQKDNLVDRIQYEEIPPKVEYKLTEKGKSVIPFLKDICRWAGIYYKDESKNKLSICEKCDYTN